VTDLLIAVAGLVLGLLLGGAATWFLIRMRRPRTAVTETLVCEADDYIEQVAEAWAAARGQPAAAPLMASKLRTVLTLHERKARRAGRRWWP